MPSWTAVHRARNVHRIVITFNRVGEEQWVLLQSDVHWDNPHCDWDLLEKHWEMAKERHAPILDNGDFFCAMQGKYDKRANKDDLRPELQTAKYLDALVNTAAKALKPYQQLCVVRGQGNHETSILKRCETNLTERLVERLKVQGAQFVEMGGYTGFTVFELDYHGRTFPIRMFYHHGYGGGGPVTRGVIQTNRQAVYVADADIVWTGHTHDAWQMPIARVKLNQDNNAIVHTRQVHVRSAGYKDDYGDGYAGWHVERGGPPKPLGGVWMRIWMESKDRPEFEFTEAR
jgi:hypothetical protein